MTIVSRFGRHPSLPSPNTHRNRKKRYPTNLRPPAAAGHRSPSSGVCTLMTTLTRESARNIHKKCLELTQGRKSRIILFSKAIASTFSDKVARYEAEFFLLSNTSILVSGT